MAKHRSESNFSILSISLREPYNQKLHENHCDEMPNSLVVFHCAKFNLNSGAFYNELFYN